MHYLIWLLISALCFAIGEFWSKKFALHPGWGYAACVFLAYNLGTAAWLPALVQRNMLAVVGALWSVLSLLATVLIGVMVFHETLSTTHIAGLVAAAAAVLLLSL